MGGTTGRSALINLVTNIQLGNIPKVLTFFRHEFAFYSSRYLWYSMQSDDPKSTRSPHTFTKRRLDTVFAVKLDLSGVTVKFIYENPLSQSLGEIAIGSIVIFNRVRISGFLVCTYSLKLDINCLAFKLSLIDGS